MTEKTFYSIGEVAKMLNVNASLLRFWETEFKEIKPHKSKNGSRYYTQEMINLLKEIYFLTKECGYTLDGAKEKLRQEKKNPDTGSNAEVVRSLQTIKQFLLDLKSSLSD